MTSEISSKAEEDFVQEPDHPLGSRALRQRRETHEIGEEDGDIGIAVGVHLLPCLEPPGDTGGEDVEEESFGPLTFETEEPVLFGRGSLARSRSDVEYHAATRVVVATPTRSSVKNPATGAEGIDGELATSHGPSAPVTMLDATKKRVQGIDRAPNRQASIGTTTAHRATPPALAKPPRLPLEEKGEGAHQRQQCGA